MPKRLILFAALGASALLGTAAAEAQSAEPLDVFLFAGQSNMAGSGQAADLAEAMRKPSDQVLVPDDPLKPTAWVPYTPQGRMGPEVVFCHEAARALGRPVGFVKFAIGGTNLGEQWNPDGGPLYGKFRDRVRAAQSLGNVEITAMLWMQGEKDSRIEWMAEKYVENLAKLVETARKDFRSPEMIFVCGRVNPHFPVGKVPEAAPERYPYTFTVRKAQEELDLPRCAWVDCDDLAKHGDVLHYNSAGQIELGKRFAAKVMEVLGK